MPLDVIKKVGLEYQIIVQHPSELVFTFANTYYQGFNLGANLAKAINYATKLDNFNSYKLCTSICLSGEQIPKLSMLPAKEVRQVPKRGLADKLDKNSKKPRTTVKGVLPLFANPSFIAHVLQHAIAAKRRASQKKALARDDLLGL